MAEMVSIKFNTHSDVRYLKCLCEKYLVDDSYRFIPDPTGFMVYECLEIDSEGLVILKLSCDNWNECLRAGSVGVDFRR